MRARYPDIEGFVERDGVKVAYEVFGAGQPALVFAPTDPLVHSRAWKAQVPDLAQAFQVLTIDPRGNGKSDRPRSAAAYADTEFVADTIAVMDAAGIDQAVLVGHCTGAWTALLTASLHPGRVLGVVGVAAWIPFLTPPNPARVVHGFDQVHDTDEGWAKENRHYWLRDWRGLASTRSDPKSGMRFARNSATGPVRRSAWSLSAGLASAPACCAGPRRPARRRGGSFPACG